MHKTPVAPTIIIHQDDSYSTRSQYLCKYIVCNFCKLGGHANTNYWRDKLSTMGIRYSHLPRRKKNEV